MFSWIVSAFIFTDAPRHFLKSVWDATWKFLVFPLRHYDPHLGRDCRPLINQARLLFRRSSHCGDVNVITGNWTPGDRQGNINERRRRELEDLSLTLYTSSSVLHFPFSQYLPIRGGSGKTFHAWRGRPVSHTQNQDLILGNENKKFFLIRINETQQCSRKLLRIVWLWVGWRLHSFVASAPTALPSVLCSFFIFDLISAILATLNLSKYSPESTATNPTAVFAISSLCRVFNRNYVYISTTLLHFSILLHYC